MGIFRLSRQRSTPEREPRTGPAADPHAVLLRRAGRGDQEAFAELYDELCALVNGVVLKVVRDPSQADEVTQEVFVELWRLAARYDEERGSVRSWSATVAHRRAIDRVRSEQSSRDRVARQVSNISIDHDEVSEQVIGDIDGTFDKARVRRALTRITVVQREAIELAFYGGHTYREVAMLLDIAEGTVKTRIRDGMIRLRDELGGTA